MTTQTFSHRVQYYWRIFSTGLSFTVFGIGGLILGYVIIPILQFTTFDKEKRKKRSQHAISIAFRFFIWIMKSLGLLTADYKNFELLEQDRGTLFISNHPTLIDYVSIIAHVKHCEIIVKKKLWNNIFINRVIRSAGYIPNLESEETLHMIQNELDKGNNLLIFPEGTRSTPGQPIKLKRGAAQLAIRTGAPIRVIRITCKPITLTKDKKWYQVADRRSHMTFSVGDLVDSKSFLQDTEFPSLAARRLTQRLTELLEGKA